MPMPGAGDPYFYEWYVGLENVIKMLNPDSGIRCVVFQHDEYDAVDDVVVEYADGDTQMCYQQLLEVLHLGVCWRPPKTNAYLKQCFRDGSGPVPLQAR